MQIKKILIIVLSIALLTAFNVFNSLKINPTQLTIREETLKSDKIDSSFDGKIIAYFSDLNYGGVIGKEELEILIDTVNSVNPDIVLFGGDLLFTDSVDTDMMIEELSSIRSGIGKYYVLGEEDGGLAEDILTSSGFESLDGSSIQVYSKNGSAINLAGMSIDGNYDDTNLTSDYTIFLTHYPDNAANIYNADYILAGHSLGGRVYFPIISAFIDMDGASRYKHGKHNVNSATLDITNGVGTKEKSARFLADAEVVFYKLSSN